MNNTSRTGAGAAPWCEAEGGPAPARHRHSSSSAASCARSGAVRLYLLFTTGIHAVAPSLAFSSQDTESWNGL